MKGFLRLETVGDNNNYFPGEKDTQQSREKWLRGFADALTGQHSPILHTARQRLHTGSLHHSSEQIACRRNDQILRQARKSSPQTNLRSRPQKESRGSTY